MTELIQQLATIDVSTGALTELKPDEIFRNFSTNFAKLGDLKRFVSEHEKKNFIIRWFQSGKLAEAQLDSTVVQAEFSKAIGQLMMISVLQSKKLAEQQKTLTSQQADLKKQAKEILGQTEDISTQQVAQAKQAKDLKALVENYFELKGLTQDGAAKLVAIATEVRGTKISMVEEVSRRLLDMRQTLDENLERVDHHVSSLTEAVDKAVLQANSVDEQVEDLAGALELVREDLATSLLEQAQRTNAVEQSLEGMVRRADKGDEYVTKLHEQIAALEGQRLVAAKAADALKSFAETQAATVRLVEQQLRGSKSRLAISSIVAASGLALGLVSVAMLISRH